MKIRIPSPKEMGKTALAFTARAASFFILFLMKRVMQLLGVTMIPILVLTGFSLVTLDSMFNWTGGQLNMPGRSNVFTTAEGQRIKAEYIEIADQWKAGLKANEIDQIYDYKVDFNWSIMAGLDKIIHNLEKRNPKATYEQLTPTYIFKDSTITTVTTCAGISTTKVEDIRLLTEARIYSGEYYFSYKWTTETYKSGKCTVSKTYEALSDRKENIHYNQLKAALKYFGNKNPEANYKFVIFQAYGFERELHDPYIPYIFPPSMTDLELRTPIQTEKETPYDELVPVKIPEEAEEFDSNVTMTYYDWRLREKAGAKERTDLGTLPRRGGNNTWGTAAISENNPYGFQKGDKLYVPGYGYAIVEESDQNVWDENLQGANTFETWMIEAAKFISVVGGVAWNMTKPEKEEVLYLYLNTEKGFTTYGQLVEAQMKLNEMADEPTYGPYTQQKIYLLPPDFTLDIVDNMPEPKGSFFDGTGWPITGGYDEDRGSGSNHVGVDYGTPLGTPVLALIPGYAMAVPENNWSQGNWISLEYDSPVYVNGRSKRIVLRYLHLSGFASQLEPGEKVKVERGDLIGYTGNTGWWDSSMQQRVGIHLHLDVSLLNPNDSELAKNSDKKVNPMAWIPFLKVANGTLDLYDDQNPPTGGGNEE